MNDSVEFEELRDEVETARIVDRANAVVRRTPDAHYEFVRVDGAVAVPVASGSQLDAHTRSTVLSAFLGAGAGKLYAIALEDLGGLKPRAYLVRATDLGLELFNRACAQFNYLLCSETFDQFVVCTTDDFWVALGTTEFVESAIGHSLTEGYAAFRTYATDQGWTDTMRATLRGILTAFSDRYPKLKAGTALSIPG